MMGCALFTCTINAVMAAIINAALSLPTDRSGRMRIIRDLAPQATSIDPAVNPDAAIEFADCMALLDAAGIRF